MLQNPLVSISSTELGLESETILSELLAHTVREAIVLNIVKALD